MRDNVVVFPISSKEVSISEELTILKAQDLMISAIFDDDVSADDNDQENSSLLTFDLFKTAH